MRDCVCVRTHARVFDHGEEKKKKKKGGKKGARALGLVGGWGEARGVEGR